MNNYKMRYSWDLTEIFYDYSIKNEYNEGIKLVKECFEKFPKEEDNITKIILESVKDESDNKEYFNILLGYLEYLYNVWLVTY